MVITLLSCSFVTVIDIKENIHFHSVFSSQIEIAGHIYIYLEYLRVSAFRKSKVSDKSMELRI